MDKVTFQELRRTNASLMKKAGVDPKVGADQRGHGLGVSLEVYTKTDLEQLGEGVKRLDQMVGKAGKRARKRTAGESA